MKKSHEKILIPRQSAVLPSSYASDYTESIKRNELNTKFEVAEAGLGSGQEIDTFHFICLSLNAKADYEQFNTKKALKAEVASLMRRFVELQKQKDQLKNIENIINSRE